MTLHDEFVYPDQSVRRRHARFGLALFVIVLAGLHLSRYMTGHDLFGQAAWYWFAGEALVLAGLVWLVFARRQKPQLVVSGRGLGGQWVEQRLGRMLKWHRVEKVRLEPGAVVVDFLPIDETSDEPRNRISQLRLVANEELSETKLVDAISDYMRVETVPQAA
jgi:hypothetical protein